MNFEEPIPKHPLAEVFGFPVCDMSPNAMRHRKNRLCPFNNKIPNCTKDKAQAPLGVCSIYHNDEIVITCPIRFQENWRIAEDAANFFFGPEALWTSLAEVRLKDATGSSAGNIDLVLCEYDSQAAITNFGALEIQAVYISGNVRNPFDAYMTNPSQKCKKDWRAEPNYPRPDYLSSSRKRLAPQLIFKGGIFHSWGKKSAVAMNTAFFNTLPELPVVPESQADIAWLIYDVESHSRQDDSFELKLQKKVFTRFDVALSEITKPKVGQMDDFLKNLQQKLDTRLSTPPMNKLVSNPLQ